MGEGVKYMAYMYVCMKAMSSVHVLFNFVIGLADIPS